MQLAESRNRYTAALQTVMLFLLVLGGCVLAAMAAVSNSPIVIGLVCAIVVGAVLLTRFDIVVWMLLIGTFLVNGLVALALPSMTKVAWVLSVLGFFLLFGCGLRALMPDRGNRVNLPAFMHVFMTVMFGSIAVSLISHGEVVETIVGTKRAFQFFGLMLALALFPVDETSRKRFSQWLGFCLLLAFLQLPFAVFERVVLAPKRVGMWAQGVVPLDIVSGTFEANFEGGGSSSVMVIFLMIMLTYLFTRWRDGALSSSRMFWALSVLGAPLFLGETKIALLLFPMLILFVFKQQIRTRPLQTAVILVAGAVVTVALAWLYFAVLAPGNLSPSEQLERAIAYNFGHVGYYGGSSLNRTSAVVFWFQEHGLHNPLETLFGHGLGSSYSGTSSLVPGHLSREYPRLAINLTALSTLLWDIGILGTLLYLSGFAAAWVAATRLLRASTDIEMNAQLTAVRFSIAANAIALVYSNSIVSILSHEVIVALTFGYLAWLARAQRHARSAQSRSAAMGGVVTPPLSAFRARAS